MNRLPQTDIGALNDLVSIQKMSFNPEDSSGFCREFLLCRICEGLMSDPWACSVCKKSLCFSCVLQYINSKGIRAEGNCIMRCKQHPVTNEP